MAQAPTIHAAMARTNRTRETGLGWYSTEAPAAAADRARPMSIGFQRLLSGAVSERRLSASVMAYLTNRVTDRRAAKPRGHSQATLAVGCNSLLDDSYMLPVKKRQKKLV